MAAGASEEKDINPEVGSGILMLDIYPSGEKIVVRAYVKSEEGEEPAILKKLLAAQEGGRYITSVGIDFPDNMKMLMKLSVVLSERCINATGICQNKSRPGEYSIYFFV